MPTEGEHVDKPVDDRYYQARPTFYSGIVNERTSDAMTSLKCNLIVALINAGVVDARVGMEPCELSIILNDTRVRVEMNNWGMKSTCEIDISEQTKVAAARSGSMVDSLSIAAMKCT